MLSTDVPAWSAKKFANDATGTYVRTVPQTTADPAAASMSLGFPPQCFTSESAGGTPPDGRDFNGILNFLSAWVQWFGAGGPVAYNSAISSAGGYPKGAIVQSGTTVGRVWFSTVDNNTTNPDTGGAGWTAVDLLSLTTLTAVESLFTYGSTGGVNWRKWPVSGAGTMIRMSGNMSFSGEGQLSATYPFTLSSLTDYGVSTIIPAANINYNESAQIVGTPSLSGINIYMQQMDTSAYLYPISARWFVEGLL